MTVVPELPVRVLGKPGESGLVQAMHASRAMRRLACLVGLGLFSIGCVVGGESEESGGIGDGEIPGAGAEGGALTGTAGDADSGAAEGGGDTGAATGGDEGGTEPPGTGSQVEPGTLTAGVWDDNLNYDLFSAYRAEIAGSQTPGIPPFQESEHADAHGVYADASKQFLDVSLVIDTTGSMTDEIIYLQTEFDALSSTIAQRYPNAEQRWSLVVYRDETDEYVVRWFDFRDDPAEFRAKLAEQDANGGGDYPEAADQALDIANQLDWRPDADVAKLMFWVADAPHHEDHADALADAVRGAQARGIHIYPVASSGVDELTEFSMRAAAQLTGGRYIFLTDDSGVGNSHVEPTIPCYFVTKLDDAILRMVDVELTGQYREPEASEIIRVGGDPQNGACTLADGEQAIAF